jgi:hypothetical protein
VKHFQIECGVSQPSTPGAIAMNVQGAAKNVNLRIDYITRKMLGNVPDLLIDLLEVAANIYCAEQRLGRGSNKLTNFRRKLASQPALFDPGPASGGLTGCRCSGAPGGDARLLVRR